MSAFESPYFLIRQTRENLLEFEKLATTLFHDHGGRRVVEIDPKTGKKTFKIIFNGSFSDRSRHIAASVITDIRHVLDQATYAAIETITGSDPGLVYFPIANNPKDLNGRVSKFPPQIHNTFKSFESYPTSDRHQGGNDLICALAKAAQRKHRISCKVGGRVASMGGDRGGSIKFESDGGSMPLFPEWDIDKNEMVLATTGPKGNLYHDIQISFYVAFYDAGPLTGHPVIGTTKSILSMANEIVTKIEQACV